MAGNEFTRTISNDDENRQFAALDPRHCLLEKVKEVARTIASRVRKVTEDTQLDLPSLPDDQTQEHQPLGDSTD